MLIDSSLIIDFLRRKDKSSTWFYSLISANNRPCVSVITQAELYAGKSVWDKERAKEELKLIFSVLRIIPISEEIAVNAGKIKAVYGVDLIDSIIAATAISQSTALATFNTKHFQPIVGLDVASARDPKFPVHA